MIIDLIGYIVLISALTYGISFIYLMCKGMDFAGYREDLLELCSKDEDISEDISEKHLGWMVNMALFSMIPWLALQTFKNGG